MRHLVVFFFLFLLCFAVEGSVPPECVKWFQKFGAIPGTGQKCVWKCVAFPVDMGTFYCGSHCDELCGRTVEEKYNPLVLCPKEIGLSLKNSTKAGKVNVAADKANALTEKHFGGNFQDDESDAFRHFLWAAFSAQMADPDFTEQFLEAHESCETADAGQEMDRINNDRALEYIRKNMKATEKEIVDEGLRRIKEKKMVVVRPRRKP